MELTEIFKNVDRKINKYPALSSRYFELIHSIQANNVIPANYFLSTPYEIIGHRLKIQVFSDILLICPTYDKTPNKLKIMVSIISYNKTDILCSFEISDTFISYNGSFDNFVWDKDSPKKVIYCILHSYFEKSSSGIFSDIE